jgi:hypothetical protein
MLFVRDNRVLKQIIHDIEKPDFLWEGSFVECLSREEKKIYVEYDFLHLIFLSLSKILHSMMKLCLIYHTSLIMSYAFDI